MPGKTHARKLIKIDSADAKIHTLVPLVHVTYELISLRSSACGPLRVSQVTRIGANLWFKLVGGLKLQRALRHLIVLLEEIITED